MWSGTYDGRFTIELRIDSWSGRHFTGTMTYPDGDTTTRVTGTAEDDIRSLKFNIDAHLNVDPSPDVAFITVVDLMTGKTSIQQREN